MEGAAGSSPVATAGPKAIPGTTGGSIEVEGGTLAWTCPACETRNPIEANECSVCGTPFGRLLAEPTTAPEIEPQTAAVWSMLWPGLGHWKLGRRTDAVARIVIFGWAFGALLVVLVSRFGKGGLGPTFPLFMLFLGASLMIYVVVGAGRLPPGRRRHAGDELPGVAVDVGGPGVPLGADRDVRHLARCPPVTSASS